MDPLTFGDYPKSMKSLVGKRLPTFTKQQSELVKGSFDFLGSNYYTANYASYMPPPNANRITYFSDARASLSTEHNGVPIGPKAASPWLAVYPRGIRDVLLYIKAKYNNPLIYITENGMLLTSSYNNMILFTSALPYLFKWSFIFSLRSVNENLHSANIRFTSEEKCCCIDIIKFIITYQL